MYGNLQISFNPFIRFLNLNGLRIFMRGDSNNYRVRIEIQSLIDSMTRVEVQSLLIKAFIQPSQNIEYKVLEIPIKKFVFQGESKINLGNMKDEFLFKNLEINIESKETKKDFEFGIKRIEVN